MTDRRSPSLDDVRRSLERLSGPRPPAADGATPPPPAPPRPRREVRPDAPPAPGQPGRQRGDRPDAPSPAAPPLLRLRRPAPAGVLTRDGAAQLPTDAPPAAGGVAMDPRIKRRRIDVKRDEGRRRLRVLLGCVGVVGAVLAAAGAGRSPLFDVDYADVRGADHTPRADIVAAAGLRGHPAMLDVDTRRVTRQVEKLPWVLRATARRQWPGTVRIDVTERRPAAVLPAAAGAWALADRTGRILSIGPEKPAGLPVIGNIPPPERAGASVPAAATPSLLVAASLPDQVRDRIADIATLGTGEVELQLTPPGGVVRLGPPVDLDTKLSVLATVLGGADLAEVRVVDVRVPRAPALTRR